MKEQNRFLVFWWVG